MNLKNLFYKELIKVSRCRKGRPLPWHSNRYSHFVVVALLYLYFKPGDASWEDTGEGIRSPILEHPADSQGKINFSLVSAILSFLMASCCVSYPLAVGRGSPIIGPEIFNFGHLQPVTLIYQPLAVVQPQNSLPAKEGVNFDGPDPGLNANIIRGGGCSDGRKEDGGGICREKNVVYGPNPFSAIIAPTFKGSPRFYMGFMVGNSRTSPTHKRRFPFYLNGPLRVRNHFRNSRPAIPNTNEDDDD